MHYGKKASQRRQCDALGNIQLGILGSCHPCGCYFDTTTYLSIVADYAQPFMKTGFPHGCAFLHKAKMVQEWFEEHNEIEVLIWPKISLDLNPIEHLWDVLNKQVRSMEALPRNLQDVNDLLRTSWCQIPQHTFRGLVHALMGQGYFGSKRGTNAILG
ncbi:hypothetical protein M9458_024105, partial [Cirrhinus mrigala]